MKITKYEHACLVIENSTSKLIIDPGEFTKALTDFSNTAAVVITHAHGDHFAPDILTEIALANPELIIYSVKEVVDQLDGFKTQIVQPGQKVSFQNFELEFFGGRHAFVYGNIPNIENVGVMINNTIYYPGDSFDLPDNRPVKVLAVPASAPWLKTAEAIDFLKAVKAENAFPTHNALLTETGMMFTNNWLSNIAKEVGTNYQFMDISQSSDF